MMGLMGFTCVWLAVVLGAGFSNGVTGPWSSAQQAPDGSCWIMLYKGSDPINWTEASSLAVTAGGTLAISKSDSMNAFLYGVASAADLQPCDGPWLGAQRNATATTTPLTDGWLWVDGSSVGYSAWTNDQPNGSTWLTWSLRLDSNPDVLQTWAATWASAEAGQPIHSLLASFGTPPDCDANGLPDAIDIAESPELDGDLDGVIDGCCPADLTGDAAVDIQDILHILSVWNAPGGDLDQDGLTDVDDLLAVLNSFGCLPDWSR